MDPCRVLSPGRGPAGWKPEPCGSTTTFRSISEMAHRGVRASLHGKDMSSYAFEEYTQVKHVMSDITAAAAKPWHTTIFANT